MKYNHETQQHDIKLNYRYPLVNDGIEYTRDKNSRVKWDKWGKSYKVKKGDKLVSLSDLKGKSFCVNNVHSTVTELTHLTNFPYITFIYRYRTSEFGYVKELTDNSHQNLHNTISKLKHEGLGYRKISKKLNEMGIKSVTGKTFYPSLVSNM